MSKFDFVATNNFFFVEEVFNISHQIFLRFTCFKLSHQSWQFLAQPGNTEPVQHIYSDR